MLTEKWLEEYNLIKCIASSEDRGVFLCADKKSSCKVIIKENADGYKVTEELLGVKNKHLPEIISINDDYSVEKYIEGDDLSIWLSKNNINEAEVKDMILQLIEATEVLHNKGIVHRDIKPENIIIQPDGTLVLIDYSAAREYKASSEQDTKNIGTVGFAAPEQFGIAQSDMRTDIYSIGVLMNIMLTGEHPSIRLHDGKYEKIIEKCTQVNMNDRYSNDVALRDAILKASGNSNKGLISGGRSKLLLYIAAIVGAVGIVIGGNFVAGRMSGNQPTTVEDDIKTQTETSGTESIDFEDIASDITISDDKNDDNVEPLKNVDNQDSEDTTAEPVKERFPYYHDWDAIYLEVCRQAKEEWPEYEYIYSLEYKNVPREEISRCLIMYNNTEIMITEDQIEQIDKLQVDKLMNTLRTWIQNEVTPKEAIGYEYNNYGEYVEFRLLIY